MYYIGDGLRIGRRARATAVDAIMDVGQFVCYTVSLSVKTDVLSSANSALLVNVRPTM
jgi:hypothetical protein